MELYSIGMLFTFGYLICADRKDQEFNFSGFKGSCLLMFLCFTWPFFMGGLLVELTDTKQEDADGKSRK